MVNSAADHLPPFMTEDLLELETDTDALAPEMADGEQAAPSAETPVSDEGTDEGDAAVEAETVVAGTAISTPVAGTPAAPSLSQQFGVNVHGQNYALQGVMFDPATRTLSAADDRTFDRVRQLITNGREYETRWRQELTQAQRKAVQIREEVNQETIKSSEYNKTFEQLMTRPIEEVAAMLGEWRTEWPRIQANAQVAYAERMMQQAQTAQQGEAPDVEMVIEQAQNGVAEMVEQVLADQPWATPEAKAELTALMSDVHTLDRFVARAQRDDPQNRIQAGQYVADWDTARQILQQYARPYLGAYQTSSQAAHRATATSAVATNNTKALAAAAAQRAPSAAPKKSTSAAAKAKSLSKQLDDDWSEIAATMRR